MQVPDNGLITSRFLSGFEEAEHGLHGAKKQSYLKCATTSDEVEELCAKWLASGKIEGKRIESGVVQMMKYPERITVDSTGTCRLVCPVECSQPCTFPPDRDL